MLFHTFPFFIFFLFVYLIYLLVKETRFKCTWLLIASYFFYGWWNPLYLFLILYSTAADYLAVTFMEKSKKKKLWLALCILNNLLLLGFFKYAGFITDNLNRLFSYLNLSFTLPVPDILLPIGISFFVFQSMSYTIDFYRGRIKRETNFIRYAAFVALFPQLVAGPIERASHLIPQLKEKQKITIINITDGLSLFVIGFFKKVALADYLALYVDKVYAHPDASSSLALVLATFAFSWQIYFDFSAYTDMARGLARMMGFDLMINFNNPYLATGLGDFWNRWHISLSSWFKDYLYIPLGGSRRGSFNTYRNMFLTMLIAGIWHGANWTFIIWGLLHAGGRILTRKLERIRLYKEKIPRLIKQLSVFTFVTFTWIFFRSANLNDALLIIKRIFSGLPGNANFPLLAFFFCLSVWVYQFLYESKAKKFLETQPVRIVLMTVLILYLVIFASASHETFIYFQF